MKTGHAFNRLVMKKSDWQTKATGRGVLWQVVGIRLSFMQSGNRRGEIDTFSFITISKSYQSFDVYAHSISRLMS